mmetsp:Transcript_1466/g.2448  ORF Transcript_1466/g.2448 Transcript_1466/m.2448 type:complete len:95 (-) Transcript_1466:108-392(-)
MARIESSLMECSATRTGRSRNRSGYLSRQPSSRREHAPSPVPKLDVPIKQISEPDLTLLRESTSESRSESSELTESNESNASLQTSRPWNESSS